MKPLTVAGVAVLLGGSFVGLNVIGNYNGKVSGLFYTGRDAPLPPSVARHTWRVDDPKGYDAQYYHLIAHDPLLRHGTERYLDNPRLRWRRIGIPALAALAVGGEDYAYVAIQFVCLFLGSWWLARYAASMGRSMVWGLAFLLVPAVLVSLDRLTVDLALAAACIGFVWYGSVVRSSWWIYSILAIAPLIRETGMLLIAGWCVHCLVQRDWKAAFVGSACSIPAIGWWAYVSIRTPADGTLWLARYPFSGLIERTLAGETFSSGTLWLRAAGVTEILALAGIWSAFLCAGYIAWRGNWGLAETTAVIFAAFATLLGKYDIWDSAYAVGRTFSPLLILLMTIAIRDRRLALLAPVLLILPRLLLQYEAQVLAACRRISG
jgi:hypothetical protein